MINGIILNEQQERIKNEAVYWYHHSSEQVFEIDGLAGTGKSVLIGQILRELNLDVNQYLPMSYTGQASIVMRTRGFYTAKSIHASLYEVIEVDDESDILAARFGARGKRKEFKLRSFIDPAIRLFFIDEAYMVPKWMVKDILSFGIKVIVAGDAHQLPPVGDDPAFLTGNNIHHLTQLMRQAENDPIVYLSHRASKGLPIHSGQYGNNVMVIDDCDFMPQMIGWANTLVCGTNKTRESLNAYVRQLAKFDGNFPHYGERIICRKNNWEVCVDGISLANGLAGTVVNNPDPSGFNGNTFLVNFKPDLTDKVFYNVPVDYEYFIAPFNRKNEIKAGHNKWGFGELFDFSYALTTHLSQGAEYPNLVYFEEFLRYDLQCQLNYTGITRAKQGLIYVKKKNKYIQIPGYKPIL